MEPDDPAEIIHGPVSSRLRPRARVAAILENVDDLVENESASLENNDELVENNPELSNQESLALSQTSNISADSHSVTSAILNSLVSLKYLSVWKFYNKIKMPSSPSSCSCTCLLAIYSCFATILWVGLAAVLGHTTHTAVNPIITDTEGSVEIINEETVNVDFFNSHSAVKSENKGDVKPVDADQCSQSCFHYFTKMEIGEIISFLLLGYLMLANWTRISMWLHKKWITIKKTQNERESAREADRRDQEERRIQAQVQERLELQGVAVVPSDPEPAGGSHQAPAIRVDIS